MGLCYVIAQNYYFSTKQKVKRLHGASTGFNTMYSPRSHRVSHTMPKTKQNKSKSVSSAGKVKSLEAKINNLVLQNKKPKTQRQNNSKATPFATTGSVLGRSIGGMFGNSAIGAVAGRWLGSGIGSIFGSGDYQQMGTSPKYNVITNGSQMPQFDTTKQTNIVCHREYLGDIQGTAGFVNASYPLNPGMSQTFPWLSTVAQNYQEYRIHGIVFEFRSLITDFITSGAPGVVIMATNYNADSPIYATKQQMENSEFAVSVKPTINMMHGVECALSSTVLPQKFVRSGAIGPNQDLRLYDLGNFQFATQQNPVQDIGELWVSYCIEFYKPIIPIDVGGEVQSFHTGRGSVITAAPLGSIQFSNTGSLLATVTSNSILTWFAQPQQSYIITLNWTGALTALVVAPTINVIGLSSATLLANDATSEIVAPAAVATTASLSMILTFKCNLLNPGNVSITFLSNGVFPTTSFVDVFVNELDNGVTN